MAQIVIDPGHGGIDPGGGSNLSFKEKDIVLKISLEQKRHFERNGISVAMTRTTDEYLPAAKRVPRVINAGASYCISNHINSGGGEGAETIHSIFASPSIANGIMGALVKAGARKRRVFTRKHGNGDYYYMHRETVGVNTVIVEYGFADNASDTQKILKDWRKYAEAVARFYIENVFHKEFIGDDGQPVHASKPAADGAWDVRFAETGKRVGQVQQILKGLGYYTGAIDNSFGPAMLEAVKAFQKDHKLAQDGIFGPGSQAAASKALAAKQASESKAWDVRYAETGKRVGDVQKILKDLGYYKGAIDDSFGPAMLSAVKAFQRDHKLSQDGIFGPACQEAARKAQAAKKTMYRVYKDGKQTGAFREGDNALEAARKAINAGAKNIRIEEIKV